jgi:hypothetical protein
VEWHFLLRLTQRIWQLGAHPVAVLLSIASFAFGECEATVWLDYKATQIWQFPGSGAYFYIANRMAIDADGAPNAYHPADYGIDALKNSGFPNGNWRNVLVIDPYNAGRPYRQKSGNYAGYFLAKTSLQDQSLPITDPQRYVNAAKVPYIVFPRTFYFLKGTGVYGDFAMARRLPTGDVTAAILADGGPADDPLGEVSIALAERLGGKNVNPRDGSGTPKGRFLYVVFPNSKAQPSWPISPEDLQARAEKCLAAIGGWDPILACVTAQ